MRQRSATPKVTLFPFLAVLVCTMGALILLLLVTTRRLRNQFEALPAVVELVAETIPTEPPPVVDDEARRQNEEERAQRARDNAAARAAWELDRQNRLDRAAQLQAEWRQRVAMAQAEADQLARQVARAREEAAGLQSEWEQRSAETERARSMFAASDGQAERIAAELAALEAESNDLERRRALALQREDAAKQEQILRKPRFEIVAYDGASGTERRPILIECRSDRLIFASEDVTLTARQLNGYEGDRNPLRAGTEALAAHWSEVDKDQPGSRARPYVLLVIRPGGTVGYYIARKMLEETRYDMGYELVFAHEEFQWPAPDPIAVERCRTAVDAALKLPPPPNSPARSGLPGGDDALTVDRNGQFMLPEVQRIRSSRSGGLDMMGEAWRPQRGDRPAAGGNGLDAGRGPRPAGSGERPANGLGSANTPPGTTPAGDIAGALAPPRAEPLISKPRSGQGQTEAEGNSGDAASTPGQSGGAPREQLGRPPIGGRPKDSIPSPPLAPSGYTKDGGADRKWGDSQPSGAIGIEKQIAVHLYAEKLIVAGDIEVELPEGMSRLEFQHALADALQTQALTWGRAPNSFYWRPSLSVTIHPGGNLHYTRVKELTRHWGMSAQVQQSLD